MAENPRKLTREEFRALLAERVRARFNMSLEEFLKAFRAGRFDDTPGAFGLGMLVGGASSPGRSK